MILNKNRIGRFTSSKVFHIAHALKNGAFSSGGLTYINQRLAERVLRRSIDVGKYSKAMAWGKIMEYFAYEELGLEFTLVSKETIVHPRYNFWSGSPDLIVPRIKIAEIKCYYPENFFNYGSALFKGDVANLRENHAEEYWQLVSNAIILKVKRAEGICYMPRLAKLMEIRHLIEHTDFVEKTMGDDLWKYRFIAEDEIETLPYLPDDAEFSHLQRFEFEVPNEDIIYLTRRVLDAEKIINPNAFGLDGKFIRNLAA